MDPKDWSPEYLQPKTEDGKSLAGWLKQAIIRSGHGSVEIGSPGPVYVAIFHDGGGLYPYAAIAVEQDYSRDQSQEVLEGAYEMLTEKAMEDKEHLEELQRDWGDRWDEILTESFDGKVWVFKDPEEAVRALRTDRATRNFIRIDIKGRARGQ